MANKIPVIRSSNAIVAICPPNSLADKTEHLLWQDDNEKIAPASSDRMMVKCRGQFTSTPFNRLLPVHYCSAGQVPTRTEGTQLQCGGGPLFVIRVAH